MSFGDMQRMMRQVQKMQADMQRVQEEAGQRTVEASAGGGAVKAVCNGNGDLVSLAIDPAAADPADVEMLQDLVVAAVNEAVRKSRDMMSQEMAKVTGGMRMPPGLPGFPG
ncbi:MAG TPA: YbaB/EbfC family nucleoid-associated protein [Bacillota bacterium]|nr:YbaB/EbfC family nucleoid-associated protein [Bacillota bacterium]